MSGKTSEKSSGSSGSSVSTQEEEKASRDLPAPNSTEQPPLSVGLNPPEENVHHEIDTSTIPSQSTPHQVLPSEGERHEQETSNSPQILKVSRQERRRLKREKAKFKGKYLDNTSINVAFGGFTLSRNNLLPCINSS